MVKGNGYLIPSYSYLYNNPSEEWPFLTYYENPLIAILGVDPRMAITKKPVIAMNQKKFFEHLPSTQINKKKKLKK